LTRLAAALVLLCAPEAHSSGLDLAAPRKDATPVDQLAISGNACGPAALLNALSFGAPRWRTVAEGLPGDTTRARMSYVIRAHGLQPSGHVGDRLRWHRRQGINLLDLCDIGNELCAGRILPKLTHEVLLRNEGESGRDLLKRTHSRLRKSLKKGLPPVVSLRRLARPSDWSRDKPPAWRIVGGHFVVLIGMPAKLRKHAASFPIRYVDPWGGRVLEGAVRLDPHSGFPSLTAHVPSSRVGTAKVAEGETSLVSLSAALGAF